HQRQTPLTFTLSLHDALPICAILPRRELGFRHLGAIVTILVLALLVGVQEAAESNDGTARGELGERLVGGGAGGDDDRGGRTLRDRKSTRLKSSHVKSSYAVF